MGTADSDVGIELVFDEINQLSKKCKFSNCSHIHEPGCILLQAIEKKIIDEEKYTNFLKLKKEADFYQMNYVEKKEKDRKYGKFLKKAKDSLKSRGA